MVSQEGMSMENLRDTYWEIHWEQYLEMRKSHPMSDHMGL